MKGPNVKLSRGQRTIYRYPLQLAAALALTAASVVTADAYLSGGQARVRLCAAETLEWPFGFGRGHADPAEGPLIWPAK
jgi:hypothetical protein